MARKRPDSIEDYQRKERERKERERQAREEPASAQQGEEFTRGQRADRDTHIRRGQEAWKRHKDDATWVDWLAIGQALSIGRQDAMAAASTNQPIGSRYNAAFGEWLQRHGFHDIDKGDRSRLFDVMDNLPAIEQWRGTLAQTTRLRLNHPNTVLRKWKAATKPELTEEEKAEIEANKKPTLRESVARLDNEVYAKDKRIEELEARVQEAEAAREHVAVGEVPATTLFDALARAHDLANRTTNWPALSERQGKRVSKLVGQLRAILGEMCQLTTGEPADAPKPKRARKSKASRQRLPRW